MTGPEHYQHAERLLGYAQDLPAEDRGSAEDMSFLAEAQVHATLALAAATAMSGMDSGMHRFDFEAWGNAAGVPEPPSGGDA